MAKAMTLLWGAGSPPCWRVMIALEEKNLQGYNQKLLSFDKMEHKSKEVLDINPRGQLPTFKHGNTIVNDSYAVCFYLESQFKSQGNKLIPDSQEEQALMYQRMFEGLTFYDKLNAVIYYDWFVPEGERHESALNRNKEALTTELKLWEGYLQKVCEGTHTQTHTHTETQADIACFGLFKLCCNLHFFYPSWAQALMWQDRPSHWQMWSFFLQLLIFSDLGKSGREGNRNDSCFSFMFHQYNK
uniref:Glutathione S-transferase rho n=1 Tax=Haplochromis burtoni TaxID=8153 RepID=A0A3Q2WG84_HAPBU